MKTNQKYIIPPRKYKSKNSYYTFIDYSPFIIQRKIWLMTSKVIQTRFVVYAQTGYGLDQIVLSLKNIKVLKILQTIKLN